ncbi:MAG: dihydroorotate dehydrogenase, partial [Candidatus Methanoplasma sp.]|nr:dihydroorotate dehydrogenase [Candidatus Methanoplasma sp.]
MLTTSVGKLRLERPGMVASGIMDETGPSMVRMLRSGAGAVVTKSIGMEPNKGHPNPTFSEVKGGYINAMGLPNPGIELFGKEMEIAAKAGNIIGSIYGSSPEQFSILAGKMEDYGAAAVEL